MQPDRKCPLLVHSLTVVIVIMLAGFLSGAALMFFPFTQQSIFSQSMRIVHQPQLVHPKVRVQTVLYSHTTPTHIPTTRSEHSPIAFSDPTAQSVPEEINSCREESSPTALLVWGAPAGATLLPAIPDDWQTRRSAVVPYPSLQAWERGGMLTPILPAAQSTHPPAPPTATTTLAQELQPLFDQTSGIFSGIFYDISTQSIVYSHNADLVFSSASLIKIPIVMTVYHLANQGRISLDDQIVLQANVIVGGSGSIQYTAPGSVYSVRELCARMIYDSDNTAVNMLVDHIGGFAPVNQMMAEVGAGQTLIQRQMMDMQARAAGTASRYRKQTARLHAHRGTPITLHAFRGARSHETSTPANGVFAGGSMVFRLSFSPGRRRSGLCIQMSTRFGTDRVTPVKLSAQR